MKIKSNAKINLGLYITGLDDKNYHLLDATMLPISLYDDIEIEISDKDEVIFINQEVPNNNTVTKDVPKQFCNELIDQQIRYNTNAQFGHIRDMIVQEAFKPVSK